MVNVLHNMVEFQHRTFEGESSGYVHMVDISAVKDQLSLFDTDDPDREVIYHGETPLSIIWCIPHTLQWDFSFDQDEVVKHGAGVVCQIECPMGNDN